MAHLDFLLGLLIVVVVSAAPSEISTKDKRSALDTADTETNSHITEESLSDTNEHVEQSPRQKRWYNTHGIGYPPMNPIAYAHPFREEPTAFAPPDPFQQIHNRIRDLTAQLNDFRPFTSFFPVLFIPQYINCGCPTNASPQPQPQPQPNGNGTAPDVENRFPEMDDPRQNWGVVINNSVVDDTDYSRRPIDLDPFVPDTPPSRPAPPVEHGSSQAGAAAAAPAARPPPPPPPGQPQSPRGDSTTQGPPMPPTACDSAVLTCCHRPRSEVSINCFAEQGCPDLSTFENPCDPRIILRVVERFQLFYARNTS